MSRIAEQLNEFIPDAQYVVLEYRTVPGTVGVYNIVSVKRYDELDDMTKDYGMCDLETEYHEIEEMVQEVSDIYSIPANDIHVKAVKL